MTDDPAFHFPVDVFGADAVTRHESVVPGKN
jgi:hypothetical protein